MERKFGAWFAFDEGCLPYLVQGNEKEGYILHGNIVRRGIVTY